MLDIEAIAARVEALVTQGGNRGAAVLLEHTRGALLASVRSLVDCPQPRVAIVSGFFIPHAEPPAAESDGPLGAAMLARILTESGMPVTVLTDSHSAPVLRAALSGAGCRELLREVPDGQALARERQQLAASGVSHLIFIERAGLAADGKSHSMNGRDISATNLAFDSLAVDVPWTTIAIGDGGNEIGMGSLPAETIAAQVPHGAAIRCVTPVDHLLVAAVSNWGAYGLIALLGAALSPARSAVAQWLAPECEAAICDHIAGSTTMVDGVKLRPARSVDGFDLDRSGQLIVQVRRLAGIADA